MRITPRSGIAVLSALLSLSATAANLSEVQDNYYEEYLALFPIDAASGGDSDHRYDNVWPNDISVEHRAQEAAMVQKYLGQLAEFDRSKLSPAEQLNFDVLKSSLEIRSAGLDQPTHLLPVNQFWCAPLLFAQMAS